MQVLFHSASNISRNARNRLLHNCPVKFNRRRAGINRPSLRLHMMKSLKTKTSRFFRDGPSQDEKAANAQLGSEANFDAGIQGPSLRKNPSRFFLRKNDKLDKPLPARPSATASSSVVLPCLSGHVKQEDQPEDAILVEQSASTLEKPLPSPPAPQAAETPEPASGVDSANEPKLKARPSFATLRSRSSLFFRNNSAAHSDYPPAPPVPQIPVDLPVPKSPRSILTPLHSTRGSRLSTTKFQDRSISISRPVLMAQLIDSPIPDHPATVPFTKPAGPPPPRPPRPDSLDEDTLMFMRESGTRMCLSPSNRISASTATCSTLRSHASSIEARLGFPSGNGTPRSYSIESPLAARFTLDPSQPLPVRDSTGSFKCYSRFSEYIKAQQRGYAMDGVDAEDREIGPVEQYRADKGGDWALEKRISSGPGGNPGMLFRDRWGGFHLVADI